MPDTPPHERAASLAGDLTGQRVGRYVVESLLGRGGMGEVYLAHDTALQRKVAIKRLQPGRRPDRLALLKEARRASLSDPRIVTVYDVLDHGDEALLVMEYVEGKTLRRHMDHPMHLEGFWDLAIECVEALHSAHDEGLVHRDIKPENILITESGRVKILDFGLATRLPGSAGETTATVDLALENSIAGTPGYMAPEALQGKAVDARADMFSLGVTFYEAVTGLHPFRGKTTAATIDHILHTPARPAREVDERVPPSLESVLQRMLCKDPEGRHRTTQALLEDLAAAHRAATQATTRVIGVPPRARRGRPGRRVAAAAASAVLLATLASSDAVSWRVRRWLGLGLVEGPRHVAVLPLTAEGDASLASIATGLREVVSHALQVRSLGGELQLASFQEVDNESVRTPTGARARLGADLVLEGSVASRGNQLQVKLKLSDTVRHRALREAQVAVSTTEILDLATQVVEACARLLELEALPAAPVAFGTRGGGAFRRYLEGLGQLHDAADTTAALGALESFRMASRIDPRFAAARVGMARACRALFTSTQDSSWLRRARVHCDEAIAIDPSLALAQETLASIGWVGGQPDVALAALDRAIQLEPRDDLVLRQGRYLGELGDEAGELARYEQARSRWPRLWRSYWLLGWCHYRMGRYREALESFEGCIERAPLLYHGYAHAGGIYVLLGDYDRAIELCTRSLELNPSLEACTNLATAYFNLRRYDQATRTYQDALQWDLDDHQIWMNLGDAYYCSPGRRELSDQAYRQAVTCARQRLETDPEDVTAMADLANILVKLGERDEARSLAANVVQEASGDPYVDYSLALYFGSIERWTEACDWLRTALADGWPVAWVRDSPVFDAWRDRPDFESLLHDFENTERRKQA